MPPFYRLLIAGGILLIDTVLFFIPVSAIFLVYVLLTNPVWFRNFLDRLPKPEASQ